jgi:hypothetical protein
MASGRGFPSARGLAVLNRIRDTGAYHSYPVSRLRPVAAPEARHKRALVVHRVRIVFVGSVSCVQGQEYDRAVTLATGL